MKKKRRKREKPPPKGEEEGGGERDIEPLNDTEKGENEEEEEEKGKKRGNWESEACFRSCDVRKKKVNVCGFSFVLSFSPVPSSHRAGRKGPTNTHFR